MSWHIGDSKLFCGIHVTFNFLNGIGVKDSAGGTTYMQNAQLFSERGWTTWLTQPTTNNKTRLHQFVGRSQLEHAGKFSHGLTKSHERYVKRPQQQSTSHPPINSTLLPTAAIPQKTELKWTWPSKQQHWSELITYNQLSKQQERDGREREREREESMSNTPIVHPVKKSSSTSCTSREHYLG
jgi:hypothetical protein